MKVLVSGQDPSLPGGMAKYVGSLQTYLCERSDIQAVYLNETLAKARAGMASASRGSAIVESVRLLRTLDRRLRTDRPDVVHLHMAYGRSILEKALMARLAARRGVPAVVHLHGSSADVEIPKWSVRRRSWLARSFGSPHTIVALTERLRGILREALPSARIEVLANAVDLVVPAPPLLLDPPRIGFIGFLDGRKGEIDLLAALREIRDLAWTASIAGDGPNRSFAEAEAKRLGIEDRVEFLGFIGGDAKDAFFRSIDLLCLPSHAENLPISLLEAMAYGRPVIGAEVGGIPELIESGRQGWLVPPAQPSILAKSIRDAISVPERLRAMGSNAWRHVQSGYTWDVVGPKLIDIYRSTAR